MLGAACPNHFRAPMASLRLALLLTLGALCLAVIGPKFKPESIRPGHRVKRGPDWKWGNQDGGPSAFGTVIELREWKGEPDRLKFGARVLWDMGGANTYRWGAEDAWDLEVAGEVEASVNVQALRDSVPAASPSPAPLCQVGEATALRSVYLATGGRHSWRSKEGWRVFDSAQPVLDEYTDPCRIQWDGVICVGGHIMALDLSGMGLVGELPDDVMHFTHLKTLTVSSNALTGPLPLGLGRLTSLKYLSYQDNRISGELPTWISRLKELVWWSGYNNQHTGPLVQEIAMLKRLEVLRLDHNLLAGPIPAALGDLPVLKELNLNHNEMNGTVPQALLRKTHLLLRLPRSVQRVYTASATPSPEDPFADRRTLPLEQEL